jgi:hypothetical protein
VGTFTIGASMSPWVQEGPVAPYIVGSEPWDATVGGGVALLAAAGAGCASRQRRVLDLQIGSWLGATQL